MGRLNDLAVESVVIAQSASLSSVGDLAGDPFLGIQMPAAWTTAVITFQVAADKAANVANLYTSTGTEYSVPAAAGQFVQLPPADFWGVRFVKVRSGTAATPVTQSAAATVGLVHRSYD